MRKTRIALSTLLITLFVLGSVAALGAAYNELSLRHYRAVAGVPGKLYDVDGYPMHLYCTGHGAPVVVLESGLGDDFLAWTRVQPQLSRVTTVCSYDRSGFGWSALRPGRQDAIAISGQLHELLLKAGITRPFVLMGHSIGGLYLRSYAAHYPTDLAGLVFVDGATPLQDDRVPRALVKIQEQQRRDMPLQKFWKEIGWNRIQGKCAQVRQGDEPYAAWIKADQCVPSQTTAIEGELDSERLSGEQTLHAGPFPSLPILILSRDPSSRPSNWPVDVGKANSIQWNIMQEEAKSLSPHSRRIIAIHSDHNIHADRPDLVNSAVTAFITDIRNQDLSHLDGTTVYE